MVEHDVFLIATINSGQMESYFTNLDFPEMRPFDEDFPYYDPTIWSEVV